MSIKQRLFTVMVVVLFLATHELTFMEETSDGTDKNTIAQYGPVGDDFGGTEREHYSIAYNRGIDL